MIVHHLGTEKMLAKLPWDHNDDYVKAPQIPWVLDGGAPYGYAKSAGVLTFLVVRNSGHMVPMDVPEAALDMITRFLKGQGFVSSVHSLQQAKKIFVLFACYHSLSPIGSPRRQHPPMPSGLVSR
jgi:hypothetical protein